MKAIKLLLFTAILFAVLQLRAAVVSEPAATRVAHNFLHQVTGSVPSNLKLVCIFDHTAFVFGHDSGFVIVAADDRAVPVLGYSTEGAFVVPVESDTVSGNNFRAWMKCWQNQIAWLKENNPPAKEEIVLQWQNLLSGKVSRNTATSVAPLLTTTWGQLWPYNSLCPTDPGGSGGHVAAGCGPLAMAQIMKYHNYPAQGLGSYGYTWGTYPYSGANFGATTYCWDSMPNSISSVNNDVATIIYHAGVAVRAEWSPGGTTTGSSTMMMAFVNYFRMAYSTMKYVSRYSYTEAGWNNLLQNELAASRPVYYQGFGTGGHAWVCDGVDATNLYHFNWGWNGLYNGYYALNDLTPGNYNFNSGQGAIIGIGPNDGSTVDQDTTWSDSITNLTNIAIPDAVTLTLNPGTTVRFAPNCLMKVWGRLVSVSSPSAYTKLTALNTADGWEGIDWHDDFGRMSDNDSSRLVYTQVEYSKSSAIDCNAFGKVLLDHCRINNNFADPNGQYPGIRVRNNPITVRNSEISYNGAGGISVTGTGNAGAEISGNDIHDNSALRGGGIMLNNSGPSIRGNTIRNNSATQSGGGIYVNGSLPILTSNLLVNNYAGIMGGALYLENTSPKIQNNLMANNTAGNSTYGSGGAIQCYMNSNPVLTGNTIVNNYSLYGGGLQIGSECYPLVKNGIIYGNMSVAGSQVNLDDISAAPVFDHCDIEGGLAGFGIGGGGGEFDTLNYTHNIDLLPLFVSPSAGAGFAFNGQNACWQLQVESGCINAGDTTGIGGQVPAFDLAGNPRCNGMIDMGAYEFHQLPLYLSVCSDTITTGTTACFNALQTITTGGNGQPFLIQPGGATFLYAGNRISLLPGTVAEYGSYLLGRITPTGPWCQPAALPSSSGIASDADETGDSESLRKIGVAVFPNPTSGNLTIETPSAHSNMPIHIRCYNMNGTCILEAAFSGGISHEITLSGQRPGIYLVSVHCGKEHVMKKIIRRSE